MPGTILVVDDDPGYIAQLDGLLSRAGHRVIGCITAAEAIKELTDLRDAIDLAVIDFITHGISSGFELIGLIQRKLPTVKIIATLPPIGAELADLAWQNGAGAIMRRPPPGEPLPETAWLEIIEKKLAEKGPDELGIRRT